MAAVISAVTSLPSFAQQDQSPQETPTPQADDQQRTERPSQQPNRNARLAADPMARIAIAVDRNNDGQFDAIETVTYYDLQVALQRSKQRDQDRSRMKATNERRSPGGGVGERPERRMRPNYGRSTHRAMRPPRPRSQQGRSQQGRSQQGRSPQGRRIQLVKMSGTITDMTTFKMSDQDEHRFAKVELPSGEKVPVDLGPVGRTDQLDLQDGDPLTVIGKRARIDDKKFICARQVMSDDQMVSVNQKPDRGMKRVQGRITELMTKRLKGKDQPYQIAEVDLQGGRSERVVLGPKSRLSELDLADGEKLRLLVRRGRYNERPALIASQINRGDKTVQVDKPRGKKVSTRRVSSEL